MDADDDFLAELDKELSGWDDKPSDNNESQIDSPSKQILLKPDEDVAPTNSRKNPFLFNEPIPDHAATTLLDSVPPPPLVSEEEFVRMQTELMQLRNFKYESLLKTRNLEKQVHNLCEEKLELTKAAIPTRASNQFSKISGVFKKSSFLSNKTDKNVIKDVQPSKQDVADAANVANLKRKIAQLESEIVLHKESKDHLATELQSINDDFEDQKQSFQKTIAMLTKKNSDLSSHNTHISSNNTNNSSNNNNNNNNHTNNNNTNTNTTVDHGADVSQSSSDSDTTRQPLPTTRAPTSETLTASKSHDAKDDVDVDVDGDVDVDVDVSDDAVYRATVMSSNADDNTTTNKNNNNNNNSNSSSSSSSSVNDNNSNTDSNNNNNDNTNDNNNDNTNDNNDSNNNNNANTDEEGHTIADDTNTNTTNNDATTTTIHASDRNEDNNQDDAVDAELMRLHELQHNVNFYQTKSNRLSDLLQKQTLELERLRSEMRTNCDVGKTSSEHNLLLQGDLDRVSLELSRQMLLTVEQKFKAQILSTSLFTCQTRLEDCEGLANGLDSELQHMTSMLEQANQKDREMVGRHTQEVIAMQMVTRDTNTNLSQLKLTNTDLTQQLELLRNEKVELTESLSEQRCENVTLRGRIEQANTALELYREQHSKLEAQLSEQQSQLEKSTQTQTHLQEQANTLAIRLEDVVKSKDVLQQEKLLQIRGNDNLAKRLSEIVNENEKSQQEDKTKLSEMTTRVDQFETLLKAETAKTTALVAEETRLATALSELTTLHTHIATVNTELESKATLLQEKSDKDCAEHALLVATLQQQLSEANARVLKLGLDLKDCEAQRKLDIKMHAKNVKTLSRQLQKKDAKAEHNTNNNNNNNNGNNTTVNKSDSKSNIGSPSSSTPTPTSPTTTPTPTTTTTAAKFERVASENVMVSPPTHVSRHTRNHSADARLSIRIKPTAHDTREMSSSKLSTGGSAKNNCSMCAKKDNKILFYESHTDDLVNNIKDKDQLIQSFLLREKTGKLDPQNNITSTNSHGVRTSHTKKAMTAELALKANTKLQQVIEDTLLQNIHLRESLDLMGSELSRLKTPR